MPLYNLLEYSLAYAKTSGSLWQYCKDIPPVDNNNAIVNFTENNLTDSFNFKVKMEKLVKLEMMEQKCRNYGNYGEL